MKEIRHKKLHTVLFSIYVIYKKRQNYKDRKFSVVAWGWGRSGK